MSAVLTTHDLGRLEAASRALLAPLAAPDARAWKAEVLRTVRPVFGADHALFTRSDGGFAYVGEEPGDDPVGARFERVMTVEADTFAFVDTDPVSGQWLRAFRAGGLGAFTTNEIKAWLHARGLDLDDSFTQHEVMWANGLHEGAGLIAPCGAGEASVQINFRSGGPGPAPTALALARALVPAFRAGLEALHRLSAGRAALDALAEPVVALDPDGREVHRNAALVALLDADPERATVEAELWRLSRDLRRLAFPRRFEAAGLAPMRRETATARGRYTLSASILPAGAFGLAESALVSVSVSEDPVAAAVRAAEAARAIHGLTAREAEVAALLAAGLPNAVIAGRLFVSPATVKRHVEGVLAKLGVANRAAVAPRLLGPAHPQPL